MKQTCKGCKNSYYFDDSKIPDEGLHYKCPKCGTSIVFNKSFTNNNTAHAATSGVDSSRESFVELLAGVLSFPLKGNGKLLLIMGTIFFGLINFFLRYNIIPFVGAIIAVLVSGYFSAYLMKIINHSADGEEELPDFPEFSDWWDSILSPFFLILFTIVFCFIPAFAYYFLIRPEHSFADPIFLLLILFGLLYMPMGIMAVSMGQSLRSLNPVIIVPSIIKVIDKYVIACAFLLVMFILEFIVKGYLASSIPLLGDLLRALLSLYFLTIEARVLGLIYYENRERLNWFGENNSQ